MVDTKLPRVVQLGKPGNPITVGNFIMMPLNEKYKFMEWRPEDMPTKVCPNCGAETGVAGGVQWTCGKCKTVHVFKGFSKNMATIDITDVSIE